MVQQDTTVERFERLIADYCGSRYGVTVDCCTHAIFLSLLYLKEIGEIQEGMEIQVPRQTYRSVPQYIEHMGLRVKPVDMHWDGRYRLIPTRIYDSAVYFEDDIYIDDSFYCLSFQYRKTLPIGRGGMILLDDKKAMERLQELRLNGHLGWEMYMTPEQAARGITLFEMKEKKTCWKDYDDWTVKQ